MPKKSKPSPLSSPTIISGRFSLLSAGPNVALVKEQGVIAVLDLEGDGREALTGFNDANTLARFEMDARNVVMCCQRGELSDHEHHVTFSRRGASGWTAAESFKVEDAPKDFLRGAAVSGDLMALGWPGTVALFAFKAGQWQEVDRVHVDETYYGANIALDDDSQQMVVASWSAPHHYLIDDERCVESTIDFEPDHKLGNISAVDVRGDVFVVACEDAQVHISEHGVRTGFGRMRAGLLLVYRREGDRFKAPELLTGTDGRMVGGVEFDHLGQDVVVGDGFILASSRHQRTQKNHLTVFSDTPSGYQQCHREAPPQGNDSTRAYGSTHAVHVVTQSQHGNDGDLQVQRVNAIEPPAQKGPPAPTTIFSRGQKVGFEPKLALDDDALLVGASRGIFRCDGDALAFTELDVEKAYPDVEVHAHLEGAVARHGASLFRGANWSEQALKVAQDARLFSTSRGLVVVEGKSLSLFDHALERLARLDLPGHATYAVVANEHHLVAASERGPVVRFSSDLQTVETLVPTTAPQFGSGLALDGETVLVGSGIGVHVFEGDSALKECGLIKLARDKKQQTSFVRVGHDHLAVGSTSMNGKAGAIVVYQRDLKKRWKKRFVVDDCTERTDARFDRDALVVLRPHWGRAPVARYPLG